MERGRVERYDFGAPKGRDLSERPRGVQVAPRVDLALLIDTPSVDAPFRGLAGTYAIELVEYDPRALEPERLRKFHPSTSPIRVAAVSSLVECVRDETESLVRLGTAFRRAPRTASAAGSDGL